MKGTKTPKRSRGRPDAARRPAPRDTGARVTAFPALLGRQPRLLILGSLPGVASLQAHEYYAHPRNLFWDLMGELFGAHRGLSYAQRCAQLTEARVAVWDVLHQADRPGSLDSAIDMQTLAPNDFAPLFAAEPQLRTIAFNGQTAANLFRRRVLPLLPATLQLRLLTLPSTSPAHAGRSREQKLALWRELATLLDEE